MALLIASLTWRDEPRSGGDAFVHVWPSVNPEWYYRFVLRCSWPAFPTLRNFRKSVRPTVSVRSTVRISLQIMRCRRYSRKRFSFSFFLKAFSSFHIRPFVVIYITLLPCIISSFHLSPLKTHLFHKPFQSHRLSDFMNLDCFQISDS